MQMCDSECVWCGVRGMAGGLVSLAAVGAGDGNQATGGGLVVASRLEIACTKVGW